MGTLSHFSTSIDAKHQKIEGDPLVKKKFRKNVSQSRKKLKGDPLGFFNIRSIAKHQKTEGDPSGKLLFEKSLTMPKKLKGGPFSLSRYCMLRGKRGTRGKKEVQFARPNDSIWGHIFS